jgi:hypothetical protein
LARPAATRPASTSLLEKWQLKQVTEDRKQKTWQGLI